MSDPIQKCGQRLVAYHKDGTVTESDWYCDLEKGHSGKMHISDMDDPVSRGVKPDPIQRLIRAVVAGMEYDPGHSDLDDEQPIHVRMTLGDYRLACRLQAPEYKVTFLSENGTRCTLGNQGPLTAEAAAKIAATNNEECPSAECRVERV